MERLERLVNWEALVQLEPLALRASLDQPGQRDPQD